MLLAERARLLAAEGTMSPTLRIQRTRKSLYLYNGISYMCLMTSVAMNTIEATGYFSKQNISEPFLLTCCTIDSLAIMLEGFFQLVLADRFNQFPTLFQQAHQHINPTPQVQNFDDFTSAERSTKRVAAFYFIMQVIAVTATNTAIILFRQPPQNVSPLATAALLVSGITLKMVTWSISKHITAKHIKRVHDTLNRLESAAHSRTVSLNTL